VSFSFRCEVIRDRNSDKGAAHRQETEQEGVQIMAKLLRENLLLEARGLGKYLQMTTKTIYSSSNFLQRFLVQMLPGEGY
jgi:hypothetical protein